MKKIVLIVIDDDEDWRVAVARRASMIGEELGFEFEVLDFESTLGIQNLFEGPHIPDLVMSDMRIPDDLEGPERLFEYLRSKSLHSRMFFVTANISTHDEEVQKRTGGLIIGKSGLPDNPTTFFQKFLALLPQL